VSTTHPTAHPTAPVKPKAKKSEALLADLRAALIDEGQDPALVDVRLKAIQPRETNVVGNLADLQRVGATNAPMESEPDFVMPPESPEAVL
jgi:hypothetical protein